MGNWQLEVMKIMEKSWKSLKTEVQMAIYMSFPVGLFYYFNRPEYFEEQVIKKRKEIIPPPDIEAIDRFKKAIERVQKEKEKKWEEELKKMSKELK